MQVHENEEDQDVRLAKESKRVLSFIYNRDTSNNKRRGNYKFYHPHYHIQDIKYVQHKNINMSWYYWKFPRHPVSAEKFEIRGSNTILSHYHYRVYPKLGKGVCYIHHIPCAHTSCASKIDKYWLSNFAP